MRAFTLIEVLLVTIILGTIASVVLVLPAYFSKIAALDAGVEAVISGLRQAQTKTLSSVEDSAYGLHFEENSVTVFKGDTYNASDPENEILLIPSQVVISKIALEGGSSDVVFKRLSGQTDQYGSVTLRIQTEPVRLRTVSILESGLIRGGPIYFEETSPVPICQGVFSEKQISMAGGAQLDSYDSGGAGSTGQVEVYSNTTDEDGVSLGTNARINGTLSIGPSGDPGSVVSLAGGASITGGVEVAGEIINLAPLTPSSPVEEIESIPEPAISGNPIVVGGGDNSTVDICTTAVSSITLGTNASLTVNGSCGSAFELDTISMSGGSSLFINADIPELHANTFSLGTNADVLFSAPINLVITLDTLSLSGGSEITLAGGLELNALSLSLGTNANITTQGATTLTTNMVNLNGGAKLTSPGNLAITAQSLALGTNSRLEPGQDVSIHTNSLSMNGGVNVTSQGDLDITTGSLSMGTNSKLYTTQSGSILTNSLSMNGGAEVKSLTNIPRNMQISISSSSPVSLGTNAGITGVLYAPVSPVSLSGGSILRGGLSADTLTMGTNAKVYYDVSISGQTCII